MSDDLAERVHELEHRIAYLERELDSSYHEEKFKQLMEQVFPNGVEFTVTNDNVGHYSAEAQLEPEEMDLVIGRVQGMDDYGWQLTSNDRGEPVVRVAEGLVRQ